MLLQKEIPKIIEFESIMKMKCVFLNVCRFMAKLVGSFVAILGCFVSIDAFMPKSQRTSWADVVVELIFGVILGCFGSWLFYCSISSRR